MCFRTYKPVLDDAEYRSFDSTAEYREWCNESNENLPLWLGYRSSKVVVKFEAAPVVVSAGALPRPH